MSADPDDPNARIISADSEVVDDRFIFVIHNSNDGHVINP
jgi:hypothetical protein